MISGEVESLQAIHAFSPSFVPESIAWGVYDHEPPEPYFLLTQFREVGKQPPGPIKFTARLAYMHKRPLSPTGKFGFHTTTCHAKLLQVTNLWEDSWSVVYQKQLSHMIRLNEEKHGFSPEFQVVCRLTVEKFILLLLELLHFNGRSIKPC